MNKLKVAVLFGGCSEEYEVSIKSAKEIAEHIDTKKYDPVYLGITRSGEWKLCDRPHVDWDNSDCRLAVLSPDKKIHGMIVMNNYRYEITHIDVVFPVLHGKSGEDGSVQGLLELSGIPYVGCDIQSSVICMDKSLAYMAVREKGIAIPDFITMYPGDSLHIDTFPVFVKPARSGSSFGVTKVNNADELENALQTALQYDSKVLIEKAVSGVEVGCAVLGDRFDITTGELDQITLSHGIFRIHQEANPEEGSENALFTVPANVPPEKYAEIQETAKTIFKALGCRGLARVDMFLEESGRIIFNEVNTLPGFTSYSRYPRMMAAAGITFTELIDRLIMFTVKG